MRRARLEHPTQMDLVEYVAPVALAKPQRRASEISTAKTSEAERGSYWDRATGHAATHPLVPEGTDPTAVMS